MHNFNDFLLETFLMKTKRSQVNAEIVKLIFIPGNYSHINFTGVGNNYPEFTGVGNINPKFTEVRNLS